MSLELIFKNQVAKSHPVLRFPQKLFKLANECQSGAVSWSPDGKSVLLRYSLFKEEFMNLKSNFFKTDNISSFVRQLNLYGFRKIYQHAHKQAYKANLDLHEFANTFFRRDRPDLLYKVTRKSGFLKDMKNDVWLDSRKLSDDESSCDTIWEGINHIIESNVHDHAYLSSNKNESRIEHSPAKKLDDKVLKDIDNNRRKRKKGLIDRSVDKENRVPNEINPLAPEKKKRGRKPGSKRKPYNLKKRNKFSQKINYCPSLRKPEFYPHLIYYNDEDKSVFLRNTSRDVMLSSTMSFQETSEYLELKDAQARINDPTVRIQYALYD